MNPKKLLVFTDGGSRGNPGPAAIGFIVKNETGKILVRQGKLIGRATNNVAEYTAVIEALEWLKYEVQRTKDELKKVILEIAFFLDSQLIVNQLNGLYKIKNANLRNLIIKIRQLEKEVGSNISYHHVSREKNKEADKLVNLSFRR